MSTRDNNSAGYILLHAPSPPSRINATSGKFRGPGDDLVSKQHVSNVGKCPVGDSSYRVSWFRSIRAEKRCARRSSTKSSISPHGAVVSAECCLALGAIKSTDAPKHGMGSTNMVSNPGDRSRYQAEPYYTLVYGTRIQEAGAFSSAINGYLRPASCCRESWSCRDRR